MTAHEPRARRPSGPQHGRITLAAAVVLHALLISSLLLVSSAAPRDQEVTAIEPPDLALEPAAEPAAPTPTAPASAPASGSGSGSGSASSSRSASRPPSPSPDPAPTSLLQPIATARLPAPPISLALSAANPFVTSAAREPPDLAPAPSPGFDPSEIRDRRTPLDAKRAVDAAPVRGRAVFLAIADGNGMIIGIDVVECDGGRDGWANAVALARAALQGKKLRMPSSATRAEMRIELTSAWKLPGGHDPGTDVSLCGVPVAKGEGKQSTKVVILDPIPKLRSVQIAPDVNVTVPMISLDVIAVAGDPANIGAKPPRIVHTRLLDSKVL